MGMFITLVFSQHNTYFNILIKMQQYIPSGSFGKLSLSLLSQLKNIFVSCTDSSHPTHANVNFMSKSQVHMQLIVGFPCLPQYICCLSTGKTTGTRTPSIAPMQS